MEFRANLEGVEQIRRRLEQMEPKLARRAGIQAVASAGKVIRVQAEQNARGLFHRRSGKLFRAFKQKVRIKIQGAGRKITAFIYVGKGGRQARILERGWSHTGNRKGGPGKRIPARPFLRPAFLQKRAAALARMAEVLRQKLGLALRD